MSKTLIPSGSIVLAVLMLASLRPVAAQERIVPPSQKWEYKAVPFDADAATATKVLNELHNDGWEYVGPLANGLVAFKRPVLTAAEIVARKVSDNLQGTWTTVSTEADGVQEAEGKKREQLLVAGHKWSLKLDGEVNQQGIYKIVEAGDKLVKIDFLVTDGFKAGDTFQAVCQIDGDKLKWCGCYVSENKTRAKMLATRDDDGYFLRTAKRDK